MSSTCSSCSICCESYNKSTHKLIECMYCEFPSCRTCCQTFILNEFSVKCMNTECGKEWTRKFIQESFATTFINNSLKKHRENVLFEKERALLPATQPYAEALTEIANIEKEIDKCAKLEREIATRKYRLVNRRILLRERPLRAINGPDTQPKERRQFIKQCPVDECRGFLSTQWKCGLCETWSCPDCHMIIGNTKDAPHTCDQNNVASAKLLKDETKPCPTCTASIFKIDGCDQMWCTQCHTAFSWKTGNIEKTIHNPHYYEWLRKTQGSVPRNPLDIHPLDIHPLDIQNGQCRQRVFDYINTPRLFTRLISELDMSNSSISKDDLSRQITNLIQATIHLRMAEITNYDYEGANRDLRIKYLMKTINENTLKSRLQRAEKRHNKHREIQDVYTMIEAASTDIILRFQSCLETQRVKPDLSILSEFTPLIHYANDCLQDIKETYGGVVRRFGCDLRFIN